MCSERKELSEMANKNGIMLEYCIQKNEVEDCIGVMKHSVHTFFLSVNVYEL